MTSAEPAVAPTGHPPRRRRGRILVSLLATLVLVGLAPLGSVAWKLIDINREALKTAQQEYQLLLASSIGQRLDAHVDGLRSELVRVAKALGPAAGHRDSAGEIRRALAGVADDRMLYLRYMDLRNRSLDSGSSATLPADLEPLFVTAFRRTAESLADRGGRQEPSAIASDPILLGGNPPRPALVLSAPVFSGGTFRGVLAALVDLEPVWDALAAGRRTGHTVFAVDSSGNVFATSDPVGVPLGKSSKLLPLVERFLGSRSRASETLPFELLEAGTRTAYLGSYEATREGWGIFVQARQRDVYVAVREMVASSLTWALAAVVLAALAAVVFAGRLSTPIQTLAAASRAFAAGDFSRRVVVRSRNEIGELAETFNRMAEALEDHIRRLKRAAEENNELFLGTIRALAQAIDAKDPYTRGHSVRVNRYSVLVGRYLGLSEEEIRDIHVASLLHDVGKIGIDDAILKKPAPLTNEEFAIMKQHPVLGANIMAPIRQMKRILPGLRNHHERWRGGGYPDGLSGQNIPLMARIIAVADTFDALTTDRPYQRGVSFEAAVERLNELKGVVLDPQVVDAFNRAFQAGEIRSQEGAERQAEPAAAS
jgi:HD-GYP domain-containing protein (c-di-GMP phosphodiesterase class II)